MDLCIPPSILHALINLSPRTFCLQVSHQEYHTTQTLLDNITEKKYLFVAFAVTLGSNIN